MRIFKPLSGRLEGFPSSLLRLFLLLPPADHCTDCRLLPPLAPSEMSEGEQEDEADVVNSALLDSAHREKKVVYVGNIPTTCTPQQLKNAFIAFGPINSIQIPLDYKTQKNRGFGFVAYDEREDAQHARENMNGSEFQGRSLNVAVARPIRVKLGSRTAVWSHLESGTVGADDDDDA